MTSSGFFHRRRKDDHIFLVAFYECDDYYELQPPDTDRLFCSGKQWIGKTPSCVSTRGEDEEDEEDEEEDEGKCGPLRWLVYKGPSIHHEHTSRPRISIVDFV